MSTDGISEEAWAAFELLHAEPASAALASFDRYLKVMRQHVEQFSWTGLLGDPEALVFRRRCMFLYRHRHTLAYQEGRRPQLIEFNPRYLGYSSSQCEIELHLCLDGLALAWSHSFWQNFLPPNGWGCGCNVHAIRFESGLKRNGFNLADDPPETWKLVQGSDRRDCLSEGFENNRIPTMRQAVTAAATRIAD